MAIKNLDLRNIMADNFAGLFDAGKLIVREGTTVLCEITLQTPAFGNAVTGTVTVAGLPIDTVGLVTGVADNAIFESSVGTYTISDLTVGLASAQVVLSSLSITVDQPISLVSFTWTESETVG